MPCALAQQRLRRAPVCVLQVLSADARPAQLATEPDESPVVGTFVHEQRLPGRDTMDVDPMLLQVIRERLLHVEEHPVEPRMLGASAGRGSR